MLLGRGCKGTYTAIKKAVVIGPGWCDLSLMQGVRGGGGEVCNGPTYDNWLMLLQLPCQELANN